MMGLDLIELSFDGGVLRITIDKPGGVSMEDCVAVNRRVGLLLDAEDPIPGSYRLEVSSPGLTRRLKTAEEFAHFSGRWIKIRCSDRFYRGILAGIEGEDVIVNIEGSEVRIPLQAIVKANLDFEFRE